MYPVELIRQLDFCPRIIYFREVLGISLASNNLWVKQGINYHEKQEFLDKRRSLKRFNLNNAILLNNKRLYSEKYIFHGIADSIIATDTEIHILEYKIYAKKLYSGHIMQAISYGILAKEMLKKELSTSFIIVGTQRKVKEILITKELIDNVLHKWDIINNIIEDQTMPYSSANLHQCSQCEYLNMCNDRE